MIFLLEALAMMVRPKIDSEKYSAALNFKATLASWGAIRMRQKPLKRPPKTEAITPILRAFPAFPWRARGYPSNTVADAEGWPGALSKMAEIEPPYMAPQNMAAKTTRAEAWSSRYTRGSNRIIPIDAVIPGMAPMIIPPTTPRIIMKNVKG
jgi:hypothetical protein